MIKVKFVDADYRRLKRALRKLRHRAKFWIEANGGELNRVCAIEYSHLLVRNIMKAKRPSPPYDPRYRTWKFEYGRMGYPAPWRLFGDMVRNIVAFKSSDGRKRGGWMGGIPAGVYDSGGKSWFSPGKKGKPKKIAMYARVGELGGKFPRAGEHPARPIFGPTMEEYNNEGRQARVRDAMTDIGRAWM